MHKKKVIFVINSLALAGSEKSLVSLLSSIDRSKYEVHLQLFHYGDPLEKMVPPYVTVLEPLPYFKFAKLPIIKSLLTFKFAYIGSRLRYSLRLRNGEYRSGQKAQIFWQITKDVIKENTIKYDVGIAFAQGLPTFYVMDKINASKKVCWVNANGIFQNEFYDFQDLYYKKYDSIVAISEGTRNHLKNYFPHLSEKISVIPNIVDYQSIIKMADLPTDNFKNDNYKILTVSRLDDKMKGMDIAMETCKILRDKGLFFHWYILGKGPFQQNMESFIKENKLEKYLSLMGTTDNPYPYFKAADLYVQTSRHEGYGRTIAEARLLNIPIVTTRFDTVFGQMIDGKNGLVTDINANAVADGIERIMRDKELYNSITIYLKHEEKENKDSVKKFDGLIEKLLMPN